MTTFREKANNLMKAVRRIEQLLNPTTHENFMITAYDASPGFDERIKLEFHNPVTGETSTNRVGLQIMQAIYAMAGFSADQYTITDDGGDYVFKLATGNHTDAQIEALNTAAARLTGLLEAQRETICNPIKRNNDAEQVAEAHVQLTSLLDEACSGVARAVPRAPARAVTRALASAAVSAAPMWSRPHPRPTSDTRQTIARIGNHDQLVDIGGEFTQFVKHKTGGALPILLKADNNEKPRIAGKTYTSDYSIKAGNGHIKMTLPNQSATIDFLHELYRKGKLNLDKTATQMSPEIAKALERRIVSTPREHEAARYCYR